jgi:VWFA-related protein
MRGSQHLSITISLVFGVFTCIAAAGARVAAAQKPTESAANSETTSVIRSQTNLILVRVVVRDAKGDSVGGLTRQDFKVFDNRKEQAVSYFSAEEPKTVPQPDPTPDGAAGKQPTEKKAAEPQRFTALFFDDYHMEFGDLVRIREAAKRYLGKSLDMGERVAIFSASGNLHVEFTNDRDKLQQALSRLVLETRFEPSPNCPRLPAYLAQRVEDMDQEAVKAAEDLLQPCFCHILPCPQLPTLTREEAKKVIRYGDQGAANTIDALEKLVRRMAETPGGERTIAMVSDGFLNNEAYSYQLGLLVDHAVRARVVMNALDSKGLYVEPADESEYARQGRKRSTDVLWEAAEGTGGIFVQNTNDMEAGMNRIGALSASSYALGFAPADMKFDGQFHTLTVKLTNPESFTVQARRGYFAPKQAEDAATAENGGVEQEMFSEGEMSGLLVNFSAKFDKVDARTTKFSVIADVDIGSMHFRKEAGHNMDDVTLMVALFDADGNYLAGQKKTLKMHLSDATLRNLQNTGATMTAELKVKPGTYLVRAVLGESESQQIGASSQTVEVP